MTVTPLRGDPAEASRSPPANAEAEQALLGAIFIDGRAYSAVAGFLEPEHFSFPVNGRIYAAIAKLIERGQIANPVTLKNFFDQDAALAEIGGAKYLVQLATSAVTVINAEHYGRQILDLYLRRELIAFGEDIADRAYKQDLDDDAGAQLSRAEERLRRLSVPATSSLAWRPIVVDVGEDTGPIGPRGWLLGNTFCREYVSSVLAAGATRKTALRVAQLLALATGRPLTGEYIFTRCRVMLIGLEDGIDELRRRVRAAMRYYGITHDDIRGWFYIVSLPPEGGLFVEQGNAGPLQRWLHHEIAEKRLDLVCLDPLVKLHDAEENDNGAIEQVIGALTRTAVSHAIAVDVPHHISKGPADPGNADRARGASSFKDGGRLVYTLTPMSEEEALRYGIAPESRRSYIRLDAGKVNLTPAAQTKWFELVGVRLSNSTELYPHGDEIQVAVPWTPPDTWADLSTEALNTALTEIGAGLPDGRLYSDGSRAKDTAAWRVLQKHVPNKTEQQCRDIIKTWVRSGLLYSTEYLNPVRRASQQGLRVDDTKRPS